jgi:hypothetical protein
VLHDPRIGAVGAPRGQVLDHPLERTAGGPHALDRRDLRLDGEDRLDLERPAEPGLRAPDASAALEVVERVEAEPELQRAS